jgi:hypothetical protein
MAPATGANRSIALLYFVLIALITATNTSCRNNNCIKSEPQLYQKRTDFVFLLFIKYSKRITFTVASIFEGIESAGCAFYKKIDSSFRTIYLEK